MNRAQLLGAALLTLASLASGQQTPTSAVVTTPKVQVSDSDRAQIEALLKKYEAAYQHLSLYELQAIWPDLPNQKKEYRRVEELFRRGDVSAMQVSVQIQDVGRRDDDSAVVRCTRHEQYTMTWRSTYLGGYQVATGFGTVDQQNTRKVKSDREVEFWLRRIGGNGNWTIASVGDTGKSKHEAH